MITVKHYADPKATHAVNRNDQLILGSGYFTGRQAPHFPVPAIAYEIERFRWALVCAGPDDTNSVTVWEEGFSPVYYPRADWM